MPYVDELSADLQGALKGPVVGPIRVEMILDPDGVNIDLSDYIDRSGSIVIRKSKSVVPGSSPGRFTIAEITVRMINKNNALNPNVKGSLFYYASSRLYADAGSANSYVDVHKGDGDRFSAGDTLVLSGQNGTAEVVVSSIDTTTYTNYDRIQLTANIGTDFYSGETIESRYLPGRKVVLKNTVEGATTKVTQFTGVLKALPRVSGKDASIVLYDNFRKLLDVNLKANSYLMMKDSSGSTESTLSYNLNNYSDEADAGYDVYFFSVSGVTNAPEKGDRYQHNDALYEVLKSDIVDVASGEGTIDLKRTAGEGEPLSSGSLSRIWGKGDTTISFTSAKKQGRFKISAMGINSSKCKIGRWKLTMLDISGNYEIFDPDGIRYTGNTASDFYAGTSTDYQLVIYSSCWSDSFEKDEGFDFRTVCSLGNPVNSYDTIPAMIYYLLINDFGAGLDPNTDLNKTSYTDLIADYDEMRGAISFSTPTTVLKAVELLQQHINATQFVDNDGRFVLSVYRPEKAPATIYPLDPAVDLGAGDRKDMGRITRVWADYNFYDGIYHDRVIIPDGADEIGTPLTLKLPAYKASDGAQARSAAERILALWRSSHQVSEFELKFNHGLALDIDEVYSVSSNHPRFDMRNMVVYEITKDILKLSLRIKMYDFDLLYGHYLFYDDDNYDSGKVYW